MSSQKVSHRCEQSRQYHTKVCSLDGYAMLPIIECFAHEPAIAICYSGFNSTATRPGGDIIAVPFRSIYATNHSSTKMVGKHQGAIANAA